MKKRLEWGFYCGAILELAGARHKPSHPWALERWVDWGTVMHAASGGRLRSMVVIRVGRSESIR